MSTCKGCRQPIRWVETRAGRAMPCDPDEVREWITPDPLPGYTVKVTLQDPAGDLQTGYRAPMLQAEREIVGYVPHWSTCPNAASFKRGPRP